MKKLLVFLMMGVMVIGLSGCGKKVEDNKKGEVGGFAINENVKALTILQEDLDVFNKAVEKYTGMTFEPLALLGEQTVSGTNYMFLCKGTTVTSEPKTNYYVVVVYNDLNNNASVTSVKDFNINNYLENKSPSVTENITGGWEVNNKLESGNIDNNVLIAFNSATETLVGSEYTPLLVLAEQVVGGTNYSILSLGKSITQETNYSINVLTVYVDLDNNAKLSSIAYVDLNEFNN